MSSQRDDESVTIHLATPATSSAPPVVRWADLDAARGDRTALTTEAFRHAAEPRIARLFAKVPAPPLLGRAALQRIEARLLDGGAKASARNASGALAGYRRFAMGSGLGVFTLLLSGAVVAGGGVGAWWTLSRPKSEATAPAPAATENRGGARMRRARPPRTTAQAAVPSRGPAPAEVFDEAVLGVGGLTAQTGADRPAAPTELSPAPPPEVRAPAEPSVAPRVAAPRANGARHVALSRPSTAGQRRGPSAAPFAQPPASGLAEEARLLNRAMVDLRQRRNGVAALASVDEYLSRFPYGTLANEAQRLRVDALLSLDRKDDALRVLARLDLEPTGRGLELLTIRGELRARSDCANAVRDFDQVLQVVDDRRPMRLAERALFGRAVCALRERRDHAARADARVYLDRFPRGRFAAEARRIATGLSSSPGAEHKPAGNSSHPGHDPDPKTRPSL